MLAEPLLRVRTKRDGTIMPLFCTTAQELELAERIISEFQTAWENKEKKSELESRIEAIITTITTTESQQHRQQHYVAAASMDHVKLIRGFCALLERKCIFKAAGSMTAAGGGGSNNNNNKNDVHAARETDLSSDGRPGPPSSSSTSSSSYLQGLPLLVVSGNPAKIRKAVFEESARRGFALTENEKREIINAAAQTLQLQQQIAVSDILEAMWSDLDDNLILDQFDAATIDASTLAGWYNVSLMQTLLFRSTKLDFFVSGGLNWKNTLRQVKRLGLMYYLHHRTGSLQQENDKHGHNDDNNNDNNCDEKDRIICSLEGPPSLFKLTDRYGTSLAKLLPSIVFSEGPWQIEAWILRKTMGGEKRIYNFKMTENDVPSLLADPVYYHHHYHQRDMEEKEGRTNPSPSSSSSFPSSQHNNYFDSVVEEKFARRFLDLSTGLGWKLVREPDPLIVSGGRAFIPDFLFVKPGRKKVYLEIVGFWTPDYLERKFRKLAEIYDSAYATKLDDHMQGGEGSAKDKESIMKENKKSNRETLELLTALNEDLACSEGSPSLSFSQLQRTIPSGRMILYKKDNVPVGLVLDCLKAIDKEAIERTINDPSIKIKIDHTRDIIAIRDITREIGKVPNNDNNYDNDDDDSDGDNIALTVEVILRIVQRDNPGRYIDVAGTHLVSMSKATRLKSMLADIKRFTDACIILSQEGIPESCQAELVSKLGYDVQWQSLDPSSALLVKRERNESNVQ